MQDLFVDRLGNVIPGNNVARLDSLRFESIDSEKQQLSLKPSTRLVIPIEGLLQAIQMLERCGIRSTGRPLLQTLRHPHRHGRQTSRKRRSRVPVDLCRPWCMAA